MHGLIEWILGILAWVWSPLANAHGAIISPIHGEMRGKLGGNVYSRNKSGPYVRMHAVPTNPNSARQQSTRSHLGTCATAWSNDISAVARESWNLWASMNPWLNSLGQSIYLSGMAWFCMLNARRLDFGEAINHSPTDPSAPNGFTTMTVVLASAASADVTFTPVLPADQRVVLWSSGPIGVGANPNFRQCRMVGYSPADQVSPWTATLPYSVMVDYDVKFYAAIVSQYGRLSVFLEDRDTWSP